MIRIRTVHDLWPRHFSMVWNFYQLQSEPLTTVAWNQREPGYVPVASFSMQFSGNMSGGHVVLQRRFAQSSSHGQYPTEIWNLQSEPLTTAAWNQREPEYVPVASFSMQFSGQHVRRTCRSSKKTCTILITWAISCWNMECGSAWRRGSTSASKTSLI